MGDCLGELVLLNFRLVKKFWKPKPAFGLGLGVGLIGAIVLALRYGFRRPTRVPIPEDISPAIFASRVASTSFGEIVYHISGTGPPLVFLHGIYPGASSHEWARVYPDFVMGHEVIAADLIGFGESERSGRRMDASDYADSLAEFIVKTCAGQQPIIVASGLTAGIALLLASRHPERVKRLITLLPTGLKERGKWRAVGIGVLARVPGLGRFVYRNHFSRAPFLRGWLTKFALGDPSRRSEEMVHMLSTCAQQPGAEHAMLGFLRGRLAFDIESRLDRVVQPVTVLWPDRAIGFPLETGQSLAARLPAGHFVSIPGCGILAAMEDPVGVGALLAAELDPAIRLEGVA